MKTLKLFLVALVALFSVTSFSQTTYTIDVIDPAYLDTVTVQDGDILDFVNLDINAQFVVVVDGNGVPGYSPTPGTVTPSTSIYSKTINPGDVDFDITVSSLSTSAAVMLHVIVDNTTTGVNEVSDVTFSVYPNPTTDFLNISGDNVESVKIFDMNGRLVLSDTFTSKVDVSALVNGYYTLFVNDTKPIRFINNK